MHIYICTTRECVWWHLMWISCQFLRTLRIQLKEESKKLFKIIVSVLLWHQTIAQIHVRIYSIWARMLVCLSHALSFSILFFNNFSRLCHASVSGVQFYVIFGANYFLPLFFHAICCRCCVEVLCLLHYCYSLFFHSIHFGQQRNFFLLRSRFQPHLTRFERNL